MCGHFNNIAYRDVDIYFGHFGYAQEIDMLIHKENLLDVWYMHPMEKGFIFYSAS